MKSSHDRQMASESLLTGFYLLESLPDKEIITTDFITMDNDTIQKERLSDKYHRWYMSIDWLETQRDKNLLFCLFIHHKAAHRNLVVGTEIPVRIFVKTRLELPENFTMITITATAAAPV